MPSLNAETKNLLTSRLKRLKNWSEEKVTRVVDAYEQFLKLKAALKDYRATKLSPTTLIEEVWHLHVLDTQRYANDCFEFCGEVIHHDIDGDIDTRKLEIRRNATKVAYEMQNGKEPEGEMWKFDFTNSRDQSSQSDSASCEEAANDNSLGERNEDDFAEMKSEKILMTIDVTNNQEFHKLTISTSNGTKFIMQITGDIKMQEVLESLGYFEGRKDFEDWRIVGKDHKINHISHADIYSLMQNHGLNWTIEFPGQKLAQRFKKKQEIVYINLIPMHQLQKAYYVDVKETNCECYRVKVHKESSLQEIIRSLPSRAGAWKLVNQDSTLKEKEITCKENLEVKSPWADWFQIFVKTPCNGTITLEVFSYTTIDSLKKGIKAKINLDVTKQCLYFAGKKLAGCCTLSDYYISRESTVFLELSWNQATVE